MPTRVRMLRSRKAMMGDHWTRWGSEKTSHRGRARLDLFPAFGVPKGQRLAYSARLLRKKPRARWPENACVRPNRSTNIASTRYSSLQFDRVCAVQNTVPGVTSSPRPHRRNGGGVPPPIARSTGSSDQGQDDREPAQRAKGSPPVRFAHRPPVGGTIDHVPRGTRQTPPHHGRTSTSATIRRFRSSGPKSTKVLTASQQRLFSPRSPRVVSLWSFLESIRLTVRHLFGYNPNIW